MNEHLWTDALDSSLVSIARAEALTSKPKVDGSIRVTVIVPTFNSSGKYLPCIESLRKQTLARESFEVIIVDDCSTDGSFEEIKDLLHGEANFSVIKTQANRRQGAARNLGLASARGDFVFFLDIDDYIRADALETMLDKDDGSIEIVISQIKRVKFDGVYTSNVPRRSVKGSLATAGLSGTLGFFPVAMLIRRNFLASEGISFPEGTFFEDIPFCIMCFSIAKHFLVMNDILYFYVQYDDSTVNSMSEVKLRDSVDVMVACARLALKIDGGIEVFSRTASDWIGLQCHRAMQSINVNSSTPKAPFDFVKRTFREVDASGVFGEEFFIRVGERIDQLTSNKINSGQGSIVSSFPWGVGANADFSNKVIFFCEVDYHIRGVVPVIRALEHRGAKCILIDATRSSGFSTRRPMADEELSTYSDIDIRAYDATLERPFSTNAAAFVFMNDLTYTKELIMENFGFGVPTFGLYEGINDDWNRDRKISRRPYRSVDNLLLPGVYQKVFYEDRQTHVVGLPNIRRRLKNDYVAPQRRRVIINVNFTYDVLVDKRDQFVSSAVGVCEKMGLEYIISQHPADKADLSEYNVSHDSIYDLLQEGCVLISRFSTTILEALAMGRPVVYFNPIGERVPKFRSPIGAYSVAEDERALKDALGFELGCLDSGISVRERAALFLHMHCNTLCPKEPETLIAEAVINVLSKPQKRLSFKKGGGMFSVVPPFVKESSDLYSARTLTGTYACSDQSLDLSNDAAALVPLSADSARGVSLYPSPLALMAGWIAAGDGADAALAKALEAIRGWLDVARANRGRLTLVEHHALAARPKAFADVLAAHGVNDTTHPAPVAPSPDAVSAAIAAAILAGDDAAMRLLGELQASTLTPDGLGLPGVADPQAAVEALRDDHARLRALEQALVRTEAQIASKEAEIARSAAELAEKAGRIAALSTSVDRQAQDMRHSQQAMRKLSQDVDGLSAELSAMTQDRDRLHWALSTVYASTSWKLTGPVRGLSRLFRGGRTGGRA